VNYGFWRKRLQRLPAFPVVHLGVDAGVIPVDKATVTTWLLGIVGRKMDARHGNGGVRFVIPPCSIQIWRQAAINRSMPSRPQAWSFWRRVCSPNGLSERPPKHGGAADHLITRLEADHFPGGLERPSASGKWEHTRSHSPLLASRLQRMLRGRFRHLRLPGLLPIGRSTAQGSRTS